MKIYLFLLSICFIIHADAQNLSIVIDSVNQSNIVDYQGDANGAEIHLISVAKKPEYPGGKTAWKKYLYNTIDKSIPFRNKAIPNTYYVNIRFTVSNNGQLKDIGAESACGYGMDAEVLKRVKESNGWIPARTISGKVAAFTLRTIVKFIVMEKDVKVEVL